MKQRCADLINQTAGRQLTKAELDDIESRMRAAQRYLAINDAERMRSLSLADRQKEAVKLAQEWTIKDAVDAHERSIMDAERKAKLFDDISQFKPGVKGQTVAAKNMVLTAENRARAIAAEYISQIEGLDKADGGKLFGLLADPSKQLDIIKGMLGENTNALAAKAAKSLREVMDGMADHYIASGLPLKKMGNYLPQALDPSKVASLGESKFVAAAKERVDKRAFLNPDGSQMDDAQLVKFLTEAYKNISTDGAARAAEGEPTGFKRLVGSARNMERQLYYKDAASWQAMMDEFGKTSDLYQLVASTIHGMAKDIALAERFGRDIESNFKQALGKAVKADTEAVSGDAKKVEKLEQAKRSADRVFAAYLYPDSVHNPKWANYNAQVRGFMAASQLGSLASVITDPANLKMMAELNNLPQAKLFMNVLKEGKAGFGGDAKEYYRRMGVWFEEFAAVQGRMAEESISKGLGTTAYEITHKLAFFHAFDRGMRAGIGKTFMDVIGDYTRRFDNLADAQGESPYLERYGVTDEIWQVWRKAELDGGRSGNDKLLTPEAIRAVDQAALIDLAKDRIASRSDAFKERLAEFREKDRKTAEALLARQNKFDAFKAKTLSSIEDFSRRQAIKIDKNDYAAKARIELLKARLDKAEVEHDIAAYVATQAAHDKTMMFLESMDVGANSEKNANLIERYGEKLVKQAEALGERRAKAEAKIAAIEKQFNSLVKKVDRNVEQKYAEFESKAKKIEADIAEQTDAVEQAMKGRAEYAAQYQAKLGGMLEAEVNKLRSDASIKLLEVVYGETQFGARGSSNASAADRVMLGLDESRAGGFPGEIWRYMLQFKSMPLSLFRMHWERMSELDTPKAQAWYAAKYVTYSAVLGMLALQIGNLQSGRDPEDMTDPKVALRAIVRGGGLGFYGDVLLGADKNKNVLSLLGPGFGAAGDVLRQLAIAREEAGEGQFENDYGLAAVKWVRQNAVPFMRVSYLRAAFDRMVYDNLLEWVSPGSVDKMRRRAEAQGASYWWEPGTGNMRAPDMEKAWQEN